MSREQTITSHENGDPATQRPYQVALARPGDGDSRSHGLSFGESRTRRPILIRAIEPSDLEVYGGKDPRTLPMYSFPDAARATGIPPSTLRSWVAGQRYRTRDRWTRFHPVIERPDGNDSRLSFLNLIEAHVLRALRQTHGVPLEQVRQAVTMAEEDLGIERLLVDPRPRAYWS